MTHRTYFAQVVFALLATAALAGCEGVERDPNDPIAQAEKRGADYAWDHDLKLVTDCGALQDLDERQGCAKWVNNRED